jgi:FADH2 O2-dependent halogenase
MNPSSKTEVVIIGGGPAASSCGAYLSKAGIKNMILESAIHPRAHVGESMVTSSTRVFKDLDFLKVMEREGFTHKYGAAWHPTNKSAEFSHEFRFKEFPQPGVDQEYTYHVDRSKFDALFLKHAQELGSEVYQGVNVKEVLFDGDQACGVRVQAMGQTFDIPAKVVVDASGRKTVLGRQLGLKKNDPIFNQFVVHAWFEDVDRGEGQRGEFIHIYFLKIKRGWVWQIPINSKITSVGVVADKSVFKDSVVDQDKWFYSHLQSTPDLMRAMKNARRVNEFKAEGDYSYSMSKFCGNGWMLIGDAARFVDPIFSSGVSVALYSGKYASEQIVQAFETDNFKQETFMPFEKKVRGGVGVWYEFIRLYYKLLPLFTYFIQTKEHRLQVLQLLQGEVYDRSQVPVLDAMRKYIRDIEESPDTNVFKKALGDIPID